MQNWDDRVTLGDDEYYSLFLLQCSTKKAYVNKCSVGYSYLAKYLADWLINGTLVNHPCGTYTTSYSDISHTCGPAVVDPGRAELHFCASVSTA